MTTMTRAQHVEWCKERALAELDDDADGRGSERAMASMASDMGKHPETAGGGAYGVAGVGVELGMLEAMTGVGLRTPAEVRTWIEGFR